MMGWSGRAPPQQQAMLVRGTKDEEHAMAEALKNSIAFVGIGRYRRLERRMAVMKAS